MCVYTYLLAGDDKCVYCRVSELIYVCIVEQIYRSMRVHTHLNASDDKLHIIDEISLLIYILH